MHTRESNDTLEKQNKKQKIQNSIKIIIILVNRGLVQFKLSFTSL
jgi:hypothetical protein